MKIGERLIGTEHPPLVIAEIGINHEGDVARALEMVKAAARLGCECVKFQCHVLADEMVPQARQVYPANADESIWKIMDRCALTVAEDAEIKELTESLGMIYLSSPFSRAAVNRLESLGVVAYKIGSGECNNLPLLQHVAALGKPIILSTGMNDLESVLRSASIIEREGVDFALMHVTSMYPTPHDKVRLGALTELADAFPARPVGLSDHSLGNYACFGAVALGACILERHFTLSRDWAGPDVPISMTPDELQDLIEGSRAIWSARGGRKEAIHGEQATIDFAFSCVVTTRPVAKGDRLTADNCWVKRPGTGEILAADYLAVLGTLARTDLPADHQVGWSDITAAREHAAPSALRGGGDT